MPSASATARSARSALTASVAVARAAPSMSSSCVLPGGLEVLREVGALGLEAVGEVVEAALHLALDERARAARPRRAARARRPPPRAAPAGPAPSSPSPRRVRMSARSSSTVSNSDASLAHSSVTSGSTFSLTSLTRTWKVTSSASSSPGIGASNLRMSPTLAPRSCSSSSGTTRAAADLVEVVVGREALDRSRRGGSP